MPQMLDTRRVPATSASPADRLARSLRPPTEPTYFNAHDRTGNIFLITGIGYYLTGWDLNVRTRCSLDYRLRPATSTSTVTALD